jgi:hypothetical protein
MWLRSKLAVHECRRFLFEATPANVPALKRGPCPNGRNVWGLDKSAPEFLDFGVRALQLSHTTPCVRRERLNVRRLVLYPRRVAAAAENYRNEMRSRPARYGCAFGCTIAAPRSSLAMRAGDLHCTILSSSSFDHHNQEAPPAGPEVRKSTHVPGKPFLRCLGVRRYFCSSQLNKTQGWEPLRNSCMLEPWFSSLLGLMRT